MAESDKELWKLPFYHGLLPREDTAQMLKNHGDFLVRKSEETAGAKRSFVLSVNREGHQKHFIFRVQKGRIAVDFNQDRQGFKNIKEFVDKHMGSKDSVCSVDRIVLLNIVPKYAWELAHSTIRTGRRLGSGAFGEVREGRLTLPGRAERTVAIKEATLTKCTKEQIKEFMNEARIMRKLKNANVIEFFGVAVGEEPLMIVMELATDGALKDYLQQHHRSPRSKLYMCMGAASGLSHIHERNVIHCDIASRNCLYSEKKVKIADFGLAHELTAADKEMIRLDPKQRLPIKWLAPETVKERICTKKSDVWAFGILCWEIFEDANPPYADLKNNHEVVKMVSGGGRLQFNNKTPGPFAEFITKQVWNGGPAARCSMKKALEWMGNNINLLLAGTQSTRREAAAAGRDDRSKKSGR